MVVKIKLTDEQLKLLIAEIKGIIKKLEKQLMEIQSEASVSDKSYRDRERKFLTQKISEFNAILNEMNRANK